MENKIFEPDYKECKYCDVSYTEYDTGYTEYGCSFYQKGDCVGGSIGNGCPLAFKYVVGE